MTLEEYHEDAVHRASRLWRITHKRRHLRKWRNRINKASQAARLAGRDTIPYLGNPDTNRREWKPSKTEGRALQQLLKNLGGMK